MVVTHDDAKDLKTLGLTDLFLGHELLKPLYL